MASFCAKLDNSAMYVGTKGVSEIVGINPIIALILYQGGRIGVKNIDNIIKGSKKIKETLELKKTEFKNILSSKQDSISEYLKSVEEIDGEIKIKFRDKVGEISTIILRKEELTPYNRYICFNGCFTEETIVKTQEGNKEISKIADGEKVHARDEVTGALSYKKVKVIEKLADKIIEIKLGKEEIKATSEHLFRVKEGWIKAEEIRKGLELINDKGEAEVVEEVNEVVYNNLKVYNLEVEDYHTFYVGETGILVHNSYKIPRLEEIYKTYYKNLNEEMQIKFKGVLKEIEASGDMSKLKEFDNKFTGVGVSDVSKIEEIIDGSVVKGVSEASEGVSKAKFKYKHNPSENPKVLEDAIEDSDAIYGYSPNPKSKSIGGYANNYSENPEELIDWSDPKLVEKYKNRREEYHIKNDNISELVKKMKADGYSIEEIARAANNQRNTNRLNDYIINKDYKGLERVKKRNLKKYNNESGPTAEALYEKYGSWEKVIEKTMSANPGMDACCGLYDKYYHLYDIN